MKNGGKSAKRFWGSRARPASDSRGKVADNERIERASNLITGALSKRGLAGHAMASMAIHRVNTWLKERFPSQGAASVRTIKDGVLLIECSHSVVLQELQLQSVDLRAFCDTECRFASIQEIRLSRSGETSGNALAPGKPPA